MTRSGFGGFFRIRILAIGGSFLSVIAVARPFHFRAHSLEVSRRESFRGLLSDLKEHDETSWV